MPVTIVTVEARSMFSIRQDYRGLYPQAAPRPARLSPPGELATTGALLLGPGRAPLLATPLPLAAHTSTAAACRTRIKEVQAPQAQPPQFEVALSISGVGREAVRCAVTPCAAFLTPTV